MTEGDHATPPPPRRGRSLTVKLATAAVAGAVTLALTYFWREFPLRLALISAIAVGVLVFSTLQAATRMGNIYRRR